MKLLIYGMQSSGATSFTLFLAQRPDCLALVDVPNNFAAPRLNPPLDMVVKTVVTTAYPLATHMERFRPDRVVLLLRDPRDNYASLKTKNYGNYSGLIDEKFIILDQVFAERSRFDAVIEYEDFIERKPAVMDTICRLGWPVEDDYYNYHRRHNEILAGLWEHVPDLMLNFEFVFGNVRGKEVSEKFRKQAYDAEIEARLEELCPRLLAHYRKRGGQYMA